MLVRIVEISKDSAPAIRSPPARNVRPQLSHNKNPTGNERNAIAECIVRLPRFASVVISGRRLIRSLATFVLVENGSADTWVQH